MEKYINYRIFNIVFLKKIRLYLIASNFNLHIIIVNIWLSSQ